MNSFCGSVWSNGYQCGMRTPRPGFNSRMLTLGKLANLKLQPKWWPPPILAMRYRGGLHLVYKPSLYIIKENKYGLSFPFISFYE